MSNELTYMDCWHFVAPLIPVNTDYTLEVHELRRYRISNLMMRCS